MERGIDRKREREREHCSEHKESEGEQCRERHTNLWSASLIFFLEKKKLGSAPPCLLFAFGNYIPFVAWLARPYHLLC